MADNYILTKGKDGETIKLALHENTGVGTGTFDLGVHLDVPVIISTGAAFNVAVTGIETRLGDKNGAATSGGVSGAINQRLRHVSDTADTFSEKLQELIFDGLVSGAYNLKSLATEITSSVDASASGIISAITGAEASIIAAITGAEAAIVSSVDAGADKIVDGIAGASGATMTLYGLHDDLAEASGVYRPIINAVAGATGATATQFELLEELQKLIATGAVTGALNVSDIISAVTGAQAGIISAITGAEAGIISAITGAEAAIVSAITGAEAGIVAAISGAEASIVSAVEANAVSIVSGVSDIDMLKLQYPVLAGTKDVATGGSEVQLAATGVCVSVTIVAKAANTGVIYVGIATGRPLELSAGDSLSIPCTNLNQIYIDASVSAEGVGYLALGVV